MPDQTAIIAPPRDPWYRRLFGSPRYLVLLLAGILIIGGAAAAGLGVLGGSDDPARPGDRQGGGGGEAGGDEGDGGNGNRRAPVVPAEVRVAVLNGTTVTGLAQQLADRVAEEGFDVGTVANSADQAQQRAESVVLYAPGYVREARALNRRLGINQRQPIDAASQELAGDAVVVVIAGADQSQ